MNTKKKPIDKRLDSLATRKAGALSLFHRAADDLEAAAAAFEEIASEADERRRYFETVNQESVAEAESARDSAAKIRNLVGA